MASFPSTRRSVVASLRSPAEADRARAFDSLVAAYWRPAFVYIRRKWNVPFEDARDLVQGFFARAFEKSFFDAYDPGQGTFRTYLRLCLDRFADNERKARRRQKRGGSALPVDFERAERELALAAAPASESPEEIFRREWARALFGDAVDQLARECRSRGKERELAIFRARDLDPPPGAAESYAALAERFGTNVFGVTNALAFARRELRKILLERLAEVCGSETELAGEASALLKGFQT